jgi:translation elongation factor EF-Tu-like GTPase
MFSMTVEDVFTIRGRGVVATGKVQTGVLRVGEEVQIDGGPVALVTGIEMFRKKVDEATVGDNVGIVFGAELDRAQLSRGTVLTSTGSGPTGGLTINM